MIAELRRIGMTTNLAQIKARLGGFAIGNNTRHEGYAESMSSRLGI